MPPSSFRYRMDKSATGAYAGNIDSIRFQSIMIPSEGVLADFTVTIS